MISAQQNKSGPIPSATPIRRAKDFGIARGVDNIEFTEVARDSERLDCVDKTTA